LLDYQNNGSLESEVTRIKSDIKRMDETIQRMISSGQNYGDGNVRGSLRGSVSHGKIIQLQNKIQQLENTLEEFMKSIVEPEAQTRAARIRQGGVPIEEKYDSLMYLMKNAKIIEAESIRQSLYLFKESLSKTILK